jgi:hypothetical protein
MEVSARFHYLSGFSVVTAREPFASGLSKDWEWPSVRASCFTTPPPSRIAIFLQFASLRKVPSPTHLEVLRATLGRVEVPERNPLDVAAEEWLWPNRRRRGQLEKSLDGTCRCSQFYMARKHWSFEATALLSPAYLRSCPRWLR